MNNQTMSPAHPQTISEFVRSIAQSYDNATAITLSAETIPDESLTFAELERQSAQLAKGLVAQGVGKGTRIGFIFGNSPSFMLMLIAIARIGAIAIPVSTFIKSNELIRVLRQSDIQGLIVQRSLLGNDYVERLCDALPRLNTQSDSTLFFEETPYLRWVASSGDNLPASIRHIDSLYQAGESITEELLVSIESEVHATDQVMEIYTSGSMAAPKGVKHTHGALMFRTAFIAPRQDVEPGTQGPVPMPMFWVGGLIMYTMPNLLIGATSLCTEGTSTHSQMAMGVVLAEEDLAAMPRNKTTWAMGMTETLGPYSYGNDYRLPGYPLCPPLDNIADRYEIRVADEQGKPVAEGETGEIQIRGYALTPGLHKIERAEHFDADGFLRTGDMATIDNGRMLFVGRNGDMIKTASANVSPAEVEEEMQQLEGIHSAFVLGLPDTERGQLVAAAIIPRKGATVDTESVYQQLKQRMSSYKVPREYVVINRDEIPMLPSNKVARRKLATLMIEKLGRA